MDCYYRKIDFEEYKKMHKIRKNMNKECCWTANRTVRKEQDSTLVMTFMDIETSRTSNLTYMGMFIDKKTDGHYYKRQDCRILFKTDGAISLFNKDYPFSRTKTYFKKGEAVKIERLTGLQLIANEEKKLEVESILDPRLEPCDREHVYN